MDPRESRQHRGSRLRSPVEEPRVQPIASRRKLALSGLASYFSSPPAPTDSAYRSLSSLSPILRSFLRTQLSLFTFRIVWRNWSLTLRNQSFFCSQVGRGFLWKNVERLDTPGIIESTILWFFIADGDLTLCKRSFGFSGPLKYFSVLLLIFHHLEKLGFFLY